MFDYRQLSALAAVLDEGSFEKAAKRLHITQSAVSQRLRQLEERLGQTLVVRESPLRATAAGQRLLKHHRQVSLLEQELAGDLTRNESTDFTSLAIGINADSLATWFFDSVRDFTLEHRVLLDLRVDDQEETHHLMRSGEVVGCISASATPVQGCRCLPLGSMTYRALGSPAFAQRYCPEGLNRDNAAHSPVAVFNLKDPLQHRFIESHFGLTSFPHHFVPSSEGFLEIALQGLAYGMIPEQQATPYLEDGRLIDLYPAAWEEVPLYWHVWNLKTELTEALTRTIVREARQRLTPLKST